MSKFNSGEPGPSLVMVRNDTHEPEQIVSLAEIRERLTALLAAEDDEREADHDDD